MLYVQCELEFSSVQLISHMLQDTNNFLDNRMKNVNTMLEEEKKHSLKKQKEVSNLFATESLISLGIH